MAFSARRSLSHHLTRRLHPSLSHLLASHQCRREAPPTPPPPTQQLPSPFAFSDHLRRRLRSQTLALHLPFGAHRSFSSSAPEVGTAAGTVSDAGAGGGLNAAAGVLSDAGASGEMDAAVDVLSDAGAGGGMDAAAGVLSDAARPLGMPIHVAIASAAADWFPPVTALGHVLEAVHSFTGLNWWTSIVLTTLLMKTSMDLVPLLLKSTMFKYNSTDPRPKEGKKFGELLEKYGVNASTLKVLKAFIRVSLDFSLFLAILNMVVKVPSLKEGGAYWFTDLTTRDDLYILPALASLTCLAAVELVMRHGMVGNPMLKTLKGYRVLLFLMIPFMTFPKAVLLHWITCNLFFLGLFFWSAARCKELLLKSSSPCNKACTFTSATARL